MFWQEEKQDHKRGEIKCNFLFQNIVKKKETVPIMTLPLLYS